ncbi:uncharacterized protein CELE_C35B1.9 [Caenorhabditis elegans]|uniref:Uncharacterized protein n=1 Tax=Caenorhabditis elegans TaxID=6239 RepID=D3NQ88_CAEEL|nr:Uncharacterized protein CELE_C35B1.9 [Caenorhabditis elegans]CCD66742.1 Uncharacterized protein CELE_C35B1.9 [Caenorhabditis elegans]|eukprot:NP_001255256.1 Uncharacterized protein CELE_C35B1.9 [Caenorhabditis elegans]
MPRVLPIIITKSCLGIGKRIKPFVVILFPKNMKPFTWILLLVSLFAVVIAKESCNPSTVNVPLEESRLKHKIADLSKDK